MLSQYFLSSLLSRNERQGVGAATLKDLRPIYVLTKYNYNDKRHVYIAQYDHSVGPLKTL